MAFAVVKATGADIYRFRESYHGALPPPELLAFTRKKHIHV
jgi:hypothetical protein